MTISEDGKMWLRAAKKAPIVFGRECGFDDLRDIHNEWIKRFLLSKDDVTLQAHRGSYKTTCLAVAIALLLVIRPNDNIILLRKSDGDVKETIVTISKMLKHDMFQAFSKKLRGVPCILTQESVFHIDTNLKESARGNPQLLGLGIRSSITGKHGDIIITDDIVNIDDRISASHRERTKLAYQELQNIKNRGGRIINTGTPWHKEDAFQLMPNLEKASCYDTGLMSKEDIEQVRNSMSPSLFAANYELIHIADENRLFNNPVIDDGSMTELIFDGVCHIDAAYGGGVGRGGGGDCTAFTILKRLEDGRILVYGDLRDAHVDDVLHEFEAKRRLYRAGTLYNETNADKGYLLRNISKPVMPYHESMNKYIKISTYLKSEWNNIIFTHDTSKEYISQILEYNENSTHDDAPDSLASLLRESSSRIVTRLYKHSL